MFKNKIIFAKISQINIFKSAPTIGDVQCAEAVVFGTMYYL